MSGRRKIIKISETEWFIMNVLWDGVNEYPQGMSLGAIVNKLSETTDWCHTTIRTMIIRLSEKGIVKVEKSAGAYRYLPIPNKEETVIEETESFVDRVYGGSYVNMMKTIISSGKLSEKEKEELKSLL